MLWFGETLYIFGVARGNKRVSRPNRKCRRGQQTNVDRSTLSNSPLALLRVNVTLDNLNPPSPPKRQYLHPIGEEEEDEEEDEKKTKRRRKERREEERREEMKMTEKGSDGMVCFQLKPQHSGTPIRS